MAVSRATYVVKAERAGKWWALSSPDVPGFASQCRGLSEAGDYAREAIAFVLGVPEDSFDVDVQPPVLPDDLVLEVEQARAAVRSAERAQREAAILSRLAVASMQDSGMSGRDIAVALGLSPQRVSQLLNPAARQDA